MEKPRKKELLPCPFCGYSKPSIKADKEHKEICSSAAPITEVPCHICGVSKADVVLDRVYSSTGAEPDAQKQNVKIGVTAHCRCGNVFIDDIKSGLPKSIRQPTKAEKALNIYGFKIFGICFGLWKEELFK